MSRSSIHHDRRNRAPKRSSTPQGSADRILAIRPLSPRYGHAPIKVFGCEGCKLHPKTAFNCIHEANSKRNALAKGGSSEFRLRLRANHTGGRRLAALQATLGKPHSVIPSAARNPGSSLRRRFAQRLCAGLRSATVLEFKWLTARVLVAQHGIEDQQEFAHARDQRELAGFPALE